MHIRVAALQYMPSVMLYRDVQTDRITVGGIFGDFLNIVLTKVNISYTIVTPEDGEVGVRRYGNWTGTYGLIQNKRADMILGPSTITAERMEIVKFSEDLYSDQIGLLSARVEKHFYKDVLAQFNNLDQLTYLALFATTLFVAIFISTEKRINFFCSFWIVFKSFCNKPIKSSLPLNVSTLLLIVYSSCIVLFWVNINQVIGAYMITVQKESAIRTIEDIDDNANIIPTVISGSSNEYLFMNQKDSEIRQMWQKMHKNENQGLISKKELKTVEFLNSIIERRRVFLVGSNYLRILVIEFCQMNPDCNLYVSNKFLTPQVLAMAFKQDFDQAKLDQINKMIIQLKGMGIIEVWNKYVFYTAMAAIDPKRLKVRFCVFKSLYQGYGSSQTIVGLLQDFKPVFKLLLYASLMSFVVFVIEIILILIDLI